MKHVYLRGKKGDGRSGEGGGGQWGVGVGGSEIFRSSWKRGICRSKCFSSMPQAITTFRKPENPKL